MVAVRRDVLGAWLLRCSPARRDIAALLSGPISSWCVADNYRSRLMEPGDTILLWISGRHPGVPRGVWARGRVRAVPDRDESTDGLRVGLNLRPGAEPLITDAKLRAAGIDDLEVQRQPQGSNPSWVSVEQLSRLLAVAAG